MVIVVAVTAVAVAVNVTGLPLNPETAAVNVFVPAALPSFHAVSAAIPELLVFTVNGPATKPPPVLICPLPAVTVKVTVVPVTGLLNASRTKTAGGVVTLVLTVADWLLPAFSAI